MANRSLKKSTGALFLAMATLGFGAVAGPRESVDSLLFVVRQPHGMGRGEPSQEGIGPVGVGEEPCDVALCRLDLVTGRRDVVLRMVSGDIRGWDYDVAGTRLVLSVRQGGPDQPYRLIRLWLGPDGEVEESQTLTDGAFDAFDPSVQPDGTIVFASTVARQGDEVGGGRERSLYRCGADGSGVELAGGSTGAPFEGGVWGGVSLFHVQPLPERQGVVAVAVPAMAVTREKGWLAVADLTARDGRPVVIQLLGVGEGRLAQMQEAAAGVPTGEAPLQVEHPEFRWRYPYPLGAGRFLSTTDREIWVLDLAGEPRLLYVENELRGELAYVKPWRGWGASASFVHRSAVGRGAGVTPVGGKGG